MMVDITDKNLSKQFPVYTKAGKVWKNRINWGEVLKPGTVISTNFGIFTSRRNKNLPRHCKVTYKLGTLVDNIFTEVRESVIEYNLEMLEQYKGRKGRKYCYSLTTIIPGLFGKIRYINTYGKAFKPEEYKMYRRWIINFYHPDKNPKTSSAFMKELYFLLA